MRSLLACAAATSVFALGAAHPATAQNAAPAPAVASGKLAATPGTLTSALAALHGTAPGLTLPAAEAFTTGDRTIATGASASGAAVAGGTLHVRGRVVGDAVSYRGDIVVYDGGRITGNAIAILGKVRLEGGDIGGDTRVFGGDLATTADVAGPTSPGRAVWSQLALAAGWLAVIALVGIGVLILASTNLDAVSDALERDFTRAFLAGLGGQLALLPALAVLVVALALTILGALLIPFAIVAYVLAACGLVTLGYLAIARLAGRVVIGTAPVSEQARRSTALRALMAGLVLLMIPWFLAALLAWTAMGQLVAEIGALALSWVACTAGLGAALISRGGVRRPTTGEAQRAMSTASWLTPTPVSGVAAARRPTPIATTIGK